MKILKGTKTYPISAAQKTLRLSEIFTIEPRKVCENNIISFYMRIEKDADADILESAFNELIKNNDSLRLCFYRTIMGIRQYIKDFEYTCLERINVNGEQGFQQFIDNAIKNRIKFFDNNLVWAVIVVCAPGDCALVMRIHHATIDGFSIRLVLERLEYYYNSILNKTPLESNQFSIVKYFETQKQYIGSSQHIADRKFWFDLFTHQPKYSFPAGYRSLRGYCASEKATVSKDIYQKLKGLAGKICCTRQFLLMTIAAITTFAFTEKTNFCIVFLTHGRLNHYLKNTIGCMMNAVPIFYDIDPQESPIELIKKSYVPYLKALSHGRLPFGERLQMSYIESIKHFFNFNHGWLVFSCMDYGNLFECSDYTMGTIHTSNQTNQFYLSMLEIADERIDLELSYQAYKYHADIAKKLLEVYLRIIEYINHFPDQPIFRIVNELRESII